SGRLTRRNAVPPSRGFRLRASATHAFTDRIRASVDVAVHDDEANEDDAQDSAADTLGFYAFESTTNAQRRSIDGRVDLDAGLAQLTIGAAAEEQDGDTWSSSLSQFGPFADSAV